MFRPLILWLMQTKAYAWVLRQIIWRIRFSNWYAKIDGLQYVVGYTLLRRGDIILTVDRSKLTSYLIKGEWTHAALCVNKWLHPDSMDQYEIAEMSHKGFTKSMFFDVCKESDRFVILRVKTWSKEYIKDVVLPLCVSLDKIPYDDQFAFGCTALYCSELIYECDAFNRCRVDLSDFAGLGRLYVSPMAYYRSPDVEIVFDSNDLFAKKNPVELEN